MKQNNEVDLLGTFWLIFFLIDIEKQKNWMIILFSLYTPKTEKQLVV